ncbi:Pentatricopeptide repeat-containing protein -mitochondrial [Striga hermonthica]|uniref:Pentatricopeptide repeat-containing protein -mitochondrial n=1 Tax=Striga hermonthica TaxID=68872 RepID=A0A9N7RTZ1_STRHE|nr:Pentatricopeptide repeat-containing protein -mitochondrial [Striga hermonthica]
MASYLPRTTRTPLLRRLSLRCLSNTTTTTTTLPHSTPPAPFDPPPPPSPPKPPPNPPSRTPLEKQFETWLQTLKPGFTGQDVEDALRAQSDPDLALDIFRWTAQQRNYKHNHSTYLTMIEIAVSGKRYRAAETLIEEIIAGACPASLSLFNTMIKFCCGRKNLFSRSFDIYKKMTKSQDAKPNLETYALLLNSLMRKFDKLNVCYVYLPAVKSLAKQMKASGVIPDTFVLNMIIKAYSKCLEVDEAVRVFREMGLYGCEPNGYTYSYLAKGLCEKGRVSQGLDFYREMRGRGLVPRGSSYLILICSLAIERMFDDAIEITYDMLGNSMSPDLLTYKTLLGEICRDGRGNDAFELLEKFRKRDSFMNEKTYKTLLDGLHFLSRDL